MYNHLKSSIKKLFPAKIIFKIEPLLRYTYALSFRGNQHQCSVCSTKLKKFIRLENQDLLCPNCGSLSRDRRLYSLLKEEFIQKGQNILDFSPSRCLSRKLKKNKNINYSSTDLSGNFNADYKYDITNLEIQSDSLDLIICFHVLEHIENDAKAMQELFRILKPSGILLVQTPFKEGDIYENPSIVTEKDRLIHFGQEDHVRIYSANGLNERLQQINFTTQIRHFSEKENNYFGFSSEEAIIVAQKP